MPLFKHSIPRFRRRPARYFPDAPQSDGALSIGGELDKLARSVPDPYARKLFISEMQSFLGIYDRYLADRAKEEALDWSKVSPPEEHQIIAYERLADAGTAALNKLAVLKVNGGLGTSMGMNGAKSALEVQNNLTFLDLIVQQIEHLNTTANTDVPLLLMTSFNTEEDTLRIVKKYANRPVKITTFNQSRYPRLLRDSLLPFAKNVQEGRATWYPPGHGDLYHSLYRSGVLDRLLAQGKEYLFVSNSDNLGAIVDPRILQHMAESQSEFVMEVTSKTKGDIKGGTLINYDGTFRLLESAQVPPQHMEDFDSARRFKVFNTNNLWVNLKALKRVLENDEMKLDIISNPKSLDDGRSVIQLETVAGSAIKHFKNAHGIHVPRSRFLPVKQCSDLLLVKSDLYVLEHGRLIMNENRMFGIPPVIKLSGHFKKIQQFQKRFKQIPHIIELDHLTVSGDVHFGRNIVLRGTVISEFFRFREREYIQV